MIAYFEYNNARTIDYNLLIDPDFILVGPESDIEFIEVSGVDGDLAISNERYKGVDRVIPVYLEPIAGRSTELMASEISKWLNSDIGWKDMVFSSSPEFVYQAIYKDEFRLQNVITQYSRAVLSFRFKPYKFYRYGLKEIAINNGVKLYNPSNRPSRPRIKLMGTGNMTINIDDQNISIESVQDGVILDVMKDTITDLQGRPVWDKLKTYPFPKIPPKESKITWTGANEVLITPRWEELLP